MHGTRAHARIVHFKGESTMSLLLMTVAAALVAVAPAPEAPSSAIITPLSSCVSYLTTDPSGPQLNARRLQIGSVVTYDGASYRIFAGMTPQDICELAVARSDERNQLQSVISEQQTSIQTLRERGARNEAFRLEIESDLVRKYPYEAVVAFSLASAVITSLFIFVVLFLYRQGKRQLRIWNKFTGRNRPIFIDPQ